MIQVSTTDIERDIESTRLLAVARSQDAQAIEIFTKAFRKYMNEETSTDLLEREYRRIMA